MIPRPTVSYLGHERTSCNTLLGTLLSRLEFLQLYIRSSCSHDGAHRAASQINVLDGMSTLVLPAKIATFEKHLSEGKITILSRFGAQNTVSKGSRLLHRYGDETVLEFETFISELASVVEFSDGDKRTHARNAYVQLVSEDRFGSISQIFDSIGRERDYREAASALLQVRSFWLSTSIKYPLLRPALLRMVRGECRTITDGLTNWIIKRRDNGDRTPGVDWFHFHTAATCGLRDPRRRKGIATTIEHTIPLNLIHDRILGLRTPCDLPDDDVLDCEDKLSVFLERHVIISLLLRTEDNNILPAFKTKMPQGWKWRRVDPGAPLLPSDLKRYTNSDLIVFGARDIGCPNCLQG